MRVFGRVCMGRVSMVPPTSHRNWRAKMTNLGPEGDDRRGEERKGKERKGKERKGREGKRKRKRNPPRGW